MSLVMLSGGTTGQNADVEDNCLKVRFKTDFEQAVEDGLAFSWANLTYDPDAHDTILGVANTSTTLDLYIEKIIMGSDTSTQAVVHTSSGVTMAGTAVTGVNLNRNSSYVAPATAFCDETGNGQQAASYTGRLLAANLLAHQSVTVEVGGAIVIPYGHNIGIDLTTAATASNMTIVGYYKARAA